MPISTGWPAPAKINLFLHVTGRRPDGYHLLQTVFQFLDVGDELSFELGLEPGIRRVNAVAGLASDEDLVVRAARLLAQEAGVAAGARIHLDKRLPMGGGLGGGSSDAATTLVALNELWGLDLPPADLAALGLRLGADVPVFVHGVAAWAEGVGEVLEPFDAPEQPVLVITPRCHVETAAVFGAPDLTRHTPPLTMHARSLAATRNDCEPVTRRLYPEVGAALDWLAAHAPARMSGTGASVFAFFESDAEAEALAARVPGDWDCFTARCRNRSPLLDFLDARRDG